jgi:hypothetical protein
LASICLRRDGNGEVVEGSLLEWGWSCEDDSGQGVAEADAVSSEGCEIPEQSSEAVDGATVRGPGYSSSELNWLAHDRGIEPHIPAFDKSMREEGTFSREDGTKSRRFIR